MRTKNVLLIIIILICITGIGSYIFLNSSPQYKNITMNGVTIEVPNGNTTVSNQTPHYSIYNDTNNNVQIIVFDSEDSGFKDIAEMTSFAAIRDVNQVGSQIQSKDNISYNYSDTLKQYTYLCNFTHKNVLIITKDEKVMQHIIKSLKVDNTVNNTTSNDTNLNDTNSSNPTKSSQKSVTKSQSTSKVSSKEDPYTYAYEENGDYSRTNKKSGKKEYYFDGDGGGDGEWVSDY